MTIKEIIDQLETHRGSTALRLNEGAEESLLRSVEETWGVNLPDDFKKFYRFTNGFQTDEDLFNMIPLGEIIDNKNGNDPLYIAEYMIYSEMWQLEIDPLDCNRYEIVVEAFENKIVLANSLADFISTFLSGGVFEAGGLYEWQKEAEMRPIYTTRLKTTEFLLAVFYYGLKGGIVSKNEVTTWADKIVMHENEPEIFFMDLSLGHSQNEIITLLETVFAEKNDIVARALLGVLYRRFVDGAIDTTGVFNIIDSYKLYEHLTPLEQETIYELGDEIMRNSPTDKSAGLLQKTLDFLAQYKEFEFANYKSWIQKNHHIEHLLTYGKNGISIADQRELDRQKKKTEQQDALIFAVSLVIFLASIVISWVTYNDIANDVILSKFRTDLYKAANLYMSGFVICHLAKFISELVVKLRK